jgi:hypothetical protein
MWPPRCRCCFSDLKIGHLIDIAEAIEAGIEPEDVGTSPAAQAVAAAAVVENVVAVVVFSRGLRAPPLHRIHPRIYGGSGQMAATPVTTV